MASLNNKPILYVLNVSPFENKALFNKAYDVLSSERKEKISSFRFDRDKRLSLGAGILFEYALDMAKINDRKIVLGQNGKPYLESGNAYFNLSHSGETVICAIAPFEIGCDIEVTENPDIKIAKKFFTVGEYNDIISSADVADKFYRYWTVKESFIKATGQGLKIPLDSFGIDLKDSTVRQKMYENDYYFCEINAAKNYRCAVCGTENCSDIIISVKTSTQILSEMNL